MFGVLAAIGLTAASIGGSMYASHKAGEAAKSAAGTIFLIIKLNKRDTL